MAHLTLCQKERRALHINGSGNSDRLSLSRTSHYDIRRIQHHERKKCYSALKRGNLDLKYLSFGMSLKIGV
jgi:hypothetical protein